MMRFVCQMKTFPASIFVIVLLSLSAHVARAQLLVETAGAEQAVFVHARDACLPEDIPDAPARSFRDANGLTHLFATHFVNLGFVGPDLNSAKRDCHVVYQGARDDNPADFNDRAWLVSFWSDDGIAVYALVHNEFQGNLRPLLCPSQIYFECWYNAITLAQSTDGGFHFARPTSAIVAAPVYRFDNTVRHPIGYFGPSNIAKLGNDYYTMVGAESVGVQKRGDCLLRASDLNLAESWRAWDGSGFNVRLGNPYLDPANEPTRGCAVIDPDHVRSHILSLVRQAPTGRYIGIMAFEDGPRPGFYVSDSTDLFHWSEPRKIMDSGSAVAGECNNRPVLGYPSLLDPDSPSRNYDIVGNTAYLYFTRFHLTNCGETLDRDLMRVPITIELVPEPTRN